MAGNISVSEPIFRNKQGFVRGRSWRGIKMEPSESQNTIQLAVQHDFFSGTDSDIWIMSINIPQIYFNQTIPAWA